jgi:hypothetical protein
LATPCAGHDLRAEDVDGGPSPATDPIHASDARGLVKNLPLIRPSRRERREEGYRGMRVRAADGNFVEIIAIFATIIQHQDFATIGSRRAGRGGTLGQSTCGTRLITARSSRAGSLRRCERHCCIRVGHCAKAKHRAVRRLDQGCDLFLVPAPETGWSSSTFAMSPHFITRDLALSFAPRWVSCTDALSGGSALRLAWIWARAMSLRKITIVVELAAGQYQGGRTAAGPWCRG